MTAPRAFQIGTMFRAANAPETLPDYARQAEAGGFDELWVVEDCFFSSGIASAGVALASTHSLSVGIGILPAVVRNPAIAAMELATLARIYSTRTLLPGIGHGVSEWMAQIGALPKSQLKALEEVTIAVRALLAGETVTLIGQHVHLDKVALAYPPHHFLPLSLGVRGPKSLELSGQHADGTILAEFSSPPYVAWAREQIEVGRRAAGRTDPHRLTVFALCSIEASAAAAEARIRPVLASGLASSWLNSYLDALNIRAEIQTLLSQGDAQHFESHIELAWMKQLAVIGTPDDCAAAVRALAAAGADSVVLVPVDNDLETLNTLARQLIPLLK